MDLEPRHVTEAAAWTIDVVHRVDDARWDVVDDGAWSTRRTVDHLVDVLVLYSSYVARRATGRLEPPRDGQPSASRAHLTSALTSTAAVFEQVLASLAPKERAFHPSGSADRSGWIGMACTELLVHGADISRLAEVAVQPPEALAAATVDRVLPWAPATGTGWQRLLWATGRSPLAAMPAAGPDWWWQSAPLAEWDGRPRRRDTPPQW